MPSKTVSKAGGEGEGLVMKLTLFQKKKMSVTYKMIPSAADFSSPLLDTSLFQNL